MEWGRSHVYSNIGRAFAVCTSLGLRMQCITTHGLWLVGTVQSCRHLMVTVRLWDLLMGRIPWIHHWAINSSWSCCQKGNNLRKRPIVSLKLYISKPSIINEQRNTCLCLQPLWGQRCPGNICRTSFFLPRILAWIIRDWSNPRWGSKRLFLGRNWIRVNNGSPAKTKLTD